MLPLVTPNRAVEREVGDTNFLELRAPYWYLGG